MVHHRDDKTIVEWFNKLSEVRDKRGCSWADVARNMLYGQRMYPYTI